MAVVLKDISYKNILNKINIEIKKGNIILEWNGSLRLGSDNAIAGSR